MAAKKKKTSSKSKVSKKSTSKASSKQKKSQKKKSTSKKNTKKPAKTTKTAKSKTSQKAKSSSSKKRSSKKSTESKKKNYSAVDRQILNALTNALDNSLVIDEICERFNLTPEEVEKSIRRLENKNPPKIKTKLVMYRSKWLTELTKIDDYGIKTSKSKKSSKLVWDPVNDLPCFICPYAKKCNAGQELYNPKICPYLSDWLVSMVTGEKYTGNPFHQEYESKKTEKK